MKWLQRIFARRDAAPKDNLLARIMAEAGDDRIALVAVERPDLAEAVDGCTDEGTLRSFRLRALRRGDVWWAHRASRRCRQISDRIDVRAEQIADLVALGLGPAAREEADALPQGGDTHLQVRYARANLLIFEGRLDEARTIAHDLPCGHADRQSIAVWTGLAEACMARGDFDAALSDAHHAAATWPEIPATRASLMRAMFLSGDVDAALALADAEWPDGAERTDAPAVVACEVEILMETGQLHRALNRALSALETEPKIWPLYYVCFEAAALTGRGDEYEAAIDRLGQLPVDEPQMASILAIRAAEDGKTQEARRLLDQLKTMSEPMHLHSALGAALAAPFETRAAIDHAHRACADAAFRLDVSDIQLAAHLYFSDSAENGFERALALVEPLLPRHRHAAPVLLLYLRLLIAQERFEEARAVLEAAPAGLRGGLRLGPVELFLLAQQGRDAEAQAGWRGRLGRRQEPALNAPAGYPETVHLKWREKPDDILLFCVVYNGIDYVEWLIGYYRALGVDHFFFTDNGSTDGTFEYLAAQDDVSLFRSLDSFARSCCGVLWTNHNIRRFGIGHWCVHVDMDEALVFSGMEEERDLRELTRYLDARGFRATRSLMLDIFPESLAPASNDPFADSVWIDTDYKFFPIELPPYNGVHGGIRRRLQSRDVLLMKSPLLRVDRDSWYLTTNHTHTHVPVADLSTVLLHYKFVGDLRARVDEAIERGEHFLDALNYRSLKAGLFEAGDRLRGPGSVRYGGPQHLVDLGLMQDAHTWRLQRW